MPTKPLPRSGSVLDETGENSSEIGEETEVSRCHFMCPPAADCTDSDVDPSGTDSIGGGASSSGSAAYQQSSSRVSPARTGRSRSCQDLTPPPTASLSPGDSSQPRTDPSEGGNCKQLVQNPCRLDLLWMVLLLPRLYLSFLNTLQHVSNKV